MEKKPIKGEEQTSFQMTLPEPPRKIPRQQRSIALVDALKQSGREILEKDGRAALTLPRLSDHAGVSASSIYEYFPTLETLVGAIFDDIRQEAFAALIGRIAALPAGTSLHEGLQLLMQTLLDLRALEQQLDRDLAVKRLQYHELQRLELVGKEATSRSRAVALVIQRFAPEVAVADMDKAMFMMSHTIQSMVRVIALEKPAFLEQPDTASMLARMLHGAVGDAKS